MNRYGFELFFIAVVLSLGSLVEATPMREPLHLGFSDALRIAQQRHVQILVANERIDQSLARVTQSRAVLLPQVVAAASETRQTRDLRSAGINLGPDPLVGPFNSYDARVKVTQTIFDAAALERLKAARENRFLSEAEYRKAEQDVLALVALLFIEARQARRNLRFIQSFVELDYKSLAIIRTKFKSGTASLLDVRQARADYARSVALRRKAIADALEKRLDLAAALGFSTDCLIVFKDDQDPLKDQTLLEEEISRLLGDHPDILVAQRQLRQAKIQQGVEKAEFLPKITARGDYGPSGIDFNEANTTYTAGVQIAVPIFEGGLKTARLKEAASRTRESEAVLKNVERQTALRIAVALQDLRRIRAVIREKETAWSAARRELILSQQRKMIGSGTERDLLEVIAREASAYNEKEDTRSTYLMASVNLAHALGQMEHLIDTDQNRSLP